MRRALLLLAAAAIALLAGTLATGASQQAATRPATHVVHIAATSFEPRTVTVAVGDTVVWVNDDLYVHTATAAPGGPSSGDIAPGASWRYVPRAAGMFGYRCTYHEAMKGTLRVR